MQPQLIKDSNGINTGVFIPMDKWLLIKNFYPNVEEVDAEIPAWHMQILSERLAVIKNNPEKILPIDSLNDILDKD